jgi:hypothetical protein
MFASSTYFIHRPGVRDRPLHTRWLPADPGGQFLDVFAAFDELFHNLDAADLLADRLAGELDWYPEAVDRAAKLDQTVQRIDDLIDEIVYELYGLTEDEREIEQDCLEVFKY